MDTVSVSFSIDDVRRYRAAVLPIPSLKFFKSTLRISPRLAGE